MNEVERPDPLEVPGREAIARVTQWAQGARTLLRRFLLTKTIGAVGSGGAVVVGLIWGGVVTTLPWIIVGISAAMVTYGVAVALHARHRVLDVEAAADARVRAAEHSAADQQQQDARVRVHLDVKIAELEQKVITSQDAIDNATLFLLGDPTARRSLTQRQRPFISHEPASDLMKAAMALRSRVPSPHPEPPKAAQRRAAPPEPPDVRKVKARVRRNEVTLARLNAEAQAKAVPRNSEWAQRLKDAVHDEDYVKRIETEEGLGPKRRAAASRADQEAERRAALGLPPMPRPGDAADPITIRLDPRTGPISVEHPERRTPQDLAADLDDRAPPSDTAT